jgi:hypothetical protein
VRSDACGLIDVNVDRVVSAKVAVHHERRIDIDEIYLSSVAIVAGCGIALFEESRQRHQIVVGPDESIGWHRRRIAARLLSRLRDQLVVPVNGPAWVDDLNDLGRHRNSNLLAPPPVPGELRLSWRAINDAGMTAAPRSRASTVPRRNR